MSRTFRDVSLKTLLSAAVVTALAACNREPPAQAADTPVAAASAPAPDVQAAPYQRPTAEQLYALVAPIALFPDNLVAQTLAASTHPDQVDDARQFVQGHRDLTGAALIDAADSQPWDPSVKSLVAFPAVLDQMANNGEWTDALGQAYANEPSDVMNAIQVMRSRAQAKGNLKSTSQQKVQVVDRGEPVSQTVVEQDEIVGPPAQTIEIEPADPGVVYVPEYDPDVVYGEPVYSTVYETRYVEPSYGYRDAAIAGVVAFGAGIVVGELFAHHDHHDRPWGWDSWHTSWGGHRDGGRPAVVYDNHPYVVNRTVVNNRFVDRSVHIDNRHNFNNTFNRPGEPPRGPQGPGAPPPRPAQPDYAHMQRPNFTPGAMHATAPNARPAISAPRPGEHGFDGRGGSPIGREAAATQAAAPGQPPHPTAHMPQAPREIPSQPRQQPVHAQPQVQAQPQVAHAPPMPRNNEPSPQRNEPQRFDPQRAERPRDMPRPEQTEQHFQAPRPAPQPEQHFQAPRPAPQPEQHFQAPREMPRPEPRQPQQQPRPQPQPQEHHEQARPAPQQQHHDDHKKHD
ncbi:DUF3300 domain-containing protein [Luteibacter aegosomatissinici]|uniref:DUF3300 domain-containing protein n=1 Tax=Luteibacter aegosomatissinici TaxID=2911539 RepID=UPI001FF83214|nr:DUF3300 domain-containing protein [Luteibacter aegosomatissinici]UPG95435.1 DUF3300 domain-containing protein [Luteibacter aegosomatissinici]